MSDKLPLCVNYSAVGCDLNVNELIPIKYSVFKQKHT